MKTTVVPAQVTTVEDRIAGNFTFSQIVLLIIPLLTSTAVYVLMPPRSSISIIKSVLIFLLFLVFGTMAIRIKGKLIIEWLVIFLRFMLRPRFYVFTKCDQVGREVENVEAVKEKKKTNKPVENKRYSALPISLGEQRKFDRLFDSSSLTYRFEIAKKGGIDVSLTSKKD